MIQVEVFGFTPIPGLNEVYAESSNAHGVAGRSEVKKMAVEGQRPPGKLYILGVGVDKYRDTSLNLEYAVTDVNALVDRFKLGAKGSYSEVVARTVFDQRATKAGVSDAFAALRDAGPQDSLPSIHTLLVGLDGAADTLPKDNKVSAHELARYVAENLLEKSIQLMAGERNLQVGAAASTTGGAPAAAGETSLGRVVQEPAHFAIGADFLVSDVQRQLLSPAFDPKPTSESIDLHTGDEQMPPTGQTSHRKQNGFRLHFALPSSIERGARQR